MTDRRRGAGGRREGEDHLGLFGSWRALYTAVILYTLALVVLLYLSSRLLDHAG